MNGKRTLGKRFWLIALLASLALLSTPCARDPLSNSWNLRRLESRLKSLNHPAGTNRVATRRQLGILFGNGNHCDYFVGELRTYEGQRESIRAAYENATVLNPMTGRDERVEIDFLDHGAIPESLLPSDLSSLEDWDVDPGKAEHLYLVSFFRSYEANYDLRCH